MYCTVRRNGVCYPLPAEAVITSDWVLATTGQFLPASEFPFFSARPSTQSAIAPGLQFLLLLGLGYVTWQAINPPKRSRNNKHLPKWQRQFIRERDNETCTYCGAFDPNGHVDHRVSRKNGGTNHTNNLSWACRCCNLRKGASNARNFQRLVLWE